MRRYIDAEPLINDGFYLRADGACGCLLKTVSLADVPAADVKEVVHGKWKESVSSGFFHYDCPYCDGGFATKQKCESLPNFCDNCGADMRGDNK